MNQIFTIKPYRWNGPWVFDDPERGLIREALVAGVPEFIEKATQLAAIPNPELGILVLFSSDLFPTGISNCNGSAPRNSEATHTHGKDRRGGCARVVPGAVQVLR